MGSFMRTLVVYGSKYGATKECAEYLKMKLKGTVEVINLKQQSKIDLTAYDKVIIGTSIYAGKVRKEVSTFCQKYEQDLVQKSVGVFICCMNTAQCTTYIEDNFSKAFNNHLIEQVGCGGVLDATKMNAIERFVIKQIRKISEKQGNNSLAVNNCINFKALDTLANKMNDL